MPAALSSAPAPVPIIPARDYARPTPIYSPPVDACVFPTPLALQASVSPSPRSAAETGAPAAGGAARRPAPVNRGAWIAGGALVVMTGLIVAVAQWRSQSAWDPEETGSEPPEYIEAPDPTDVPPAGTPPQEIAPQDTAPQDLAPQPLVDQLAGTFDALEEQIRAQLLLAGLGDVTVDIDDDAIAWVGGYVANDVDQERAVNLVAAQPGIREVRYELNVGEQSAQATTPEESAAEGTDQQPADDAGTFADFEDTYTQVLRERGFEQVEVGIGPAGELILGGSVADSEEHAALYETLAILAPGVEVVDHLTIEPE